MAGFHPPSPSRTVASLGSKAKSTPDKIANLAALCSVCETVMHKAVRRADIPNIATLISLQEPAPERLSDCTDTSANSDFEKERFYAETQPTE
jgi:hypothetical protein